MSWFGFLITLLSIELLLLHGQAARIPQRTVEETCGYQACPKIHPHKLNIHLVPHTHDDVGWLKTIDQYYYGSRTWIQKAGVQYILDSVVQALLANPERKFIYVETAFLWKWWVRQTDQVKQDFKKLINEGRLEIIGGGWSMNDEATTHYHSLVDQYTWGFRRLNDTFGSCARPKIGWQIDPFGHSREQASLFAQLGFDGMFFGRLDYQDKIKRLMDKNMEFIWKGSPNLGSRANLFTVVLYNNYSPPGGFCFDILCQDEPIIDDPESPDYNVALKINELLKFAHQQSEMYRTNNIILTMGGDFTYQQAEMYFVNMDRLIRYVRELRGADVNIVYSTPSCYLKAVHDANLQWSTKSDDFFPYASDPHSYWTGYFSSRPTIKFFERMGNNLLQATKQLSVLTSLNKYDKELEHFREAMGVLQHHDAVSGTEKQLVANDYARLLYQSMQQGINIVTDAIKKWGSNKTRESSQDMYSCMLWNISSCPYTEEQNFTVTIYNPLSHEVTTPIRLPVREATYTVLNIADDSELTSQLVPIPDSVRDIPGRSSKATHDLVFLATLPPLGYKSFNVMRTFENSIQQCNNATDIGNEFYRIFVNDDGHVVVKWKNQDNINLTQSFHYYEGMVGNNQIPLNRSSGAYIFRPKTVSPQQFGKLVSYKVYKGPVVEEIHQTINDWVNQVIRVYSRKEYIEFDWLVGPIPIKDQVGKEIVTKYHSNLQSSGVFYTDSNGREMLKRRRNHRDTWDLQSVEQVSSNYYPVTNKISLKDEEQFLKLSVLTDRAEGGSSLVDGELELMLHRRLLKDDAFGVDEALNETAFGDGLIVRGSHYIVGGSTENLDDFAMNEKSLTLQMLLRPWIFVTPTDSEETMNYDFTLEKSGITKKLPPNVHILTLEPWKDGKVLLRLEHIFEVGEAKNLSNPVEIDIQDLFSTFTILSIQETTLGGNQWLNDMNRLKWEAESNDILEIQAATTVRPVEINDNVTNVLLKPMEIRTFVVEIAQRA